MDSADTRPASRRIVWLALLFGVPAIAVLLALGTWQVQRLQWKEALVATIAQRIDAAPLPLAAIEEKAANAILIKLNQVGTVTVVGHALQRHLGAGRVWLPRH